MVPVEPMFFGWIEEFVVIAPALTFNPFTMVQTLLLVGLTTGAVVGGG